MKKSEMNLEAGERLAKKLQLYTDYAHTEIKLSISIRP